MSTIESKPVTSDAATRKTRSSSVSSAAPTATTGPFVDSNPESELHKFKLYPTKGTKDIELKKYATSTDSRGFIPVYEFQVNGQPVMLDSETSMVLFTGIWRALGHAKADIVRLLESYPELASCIRKVRGGFLRIQGTWLPFEIAQVLARRVAYKIRHELVPVFGPSFPATCLSPDAPGFGELGVGLSNDATEPGSPTSGTNGTGKKNSNKDAIIKRSKARALAHAAQNNSKVDTSSQALYDEKALADMLSRRLNGLPDIGDDSSDEDADGSDYEEEGKMTRRRASIPTSKLVAAIEDDKPTSPTSPKSTALHKTRSLKPIAPAPGPSGKDVERAARAVTPQGADENEHEDEPMSLDKKKPTTTSGKRQAPPTKFSPRVLINRSGTTKSLSYATRDKVAPAPAPDSARYHPYGAAPAVGGPRSSAKKLKPATVIVLPAPEPLARRSHWRSSTYSNPRTYRQPETSQDLFYDHLLRRKGRGLPINGPRMNALSELVQSLRPTGSHRPSIDTSFLSGLSMGGMQLQAPFSYSPVSSATPSLVPSPTTSTFSLPSFAGSNIYATTATASNAMAIEPTSSLTTSYEPYRGVYFPLP